MPFIGVPSHLIYNWFLGLLGFANIDVPFSEKSVTRKEDAPLKKESIRRFTSS